MDSLMAHLGPALFLVLLWSALLLQAESASVNRNSTAYGVQEGKANNAVSTKETTSDTRAAIVGGIAGLLGLMLIGLFIYMIKAVSRSPPQEASSQIQWKEYFSACWKINAIRPQKGIYVANPEEGTSATSNPDPPPEPIKEPKPARMFKRKRSDPRFSPRSPLDLTGEGFKFPEQQDRLSGGETASSGETYVYRPANYDP